MSGSAALLGVLSVVGYVLLRHVCHRTSFRWDALEWQQNIFESSAMGLALFGACRLISGPINWALALHQLRLDGATDYLSSNLPIPFAGSVIAAFLLGIVLSLIANIVWPRDRAQELATIHHGGSLRVLLLDAHLTTRAVMLTLSNRKVYVGWVFIPPPLRKLAHVVLFPTLSGFRNSDDLSIQWTTDYSPAYLDLMARLEKGEKLQTEPSHFQLVLPLETITSATYFDKDIYDRHFATERKDSLTIPSGTATETDPGSARLAPPRPPNSPS